MGVLTGCKPRKEVLKGDLDDAIFAADFGDLISGQAPKVYGDAATFFQNTHPAKELVKVTEAVFRRLADSKDVGTMIRLSTGFGGGKTHTLMALWHLAKNIGNPALGIELLPAAGRPKSIHMAAIDLSKTGQPDFAQHGHLTTHSLWGETAFLLGGEKALRSLGEADHIDNQPTADVILKWFPPGPVLILFDEIVIYMAGLSERGQGNLLGFLSKLQAAVTKRPQTVFVITDPAGQRAYAKEAQKLGDVMLQAALKLDDILNREMNDFDPIGKETARVIARRLFEKIDSTAAQETSAAYHSLYERVVQESPGTVPADSATSEYSKKIVECYPFHPRLMDTAQGRLTVLQEFNQSRGTLRLFARILRSIWESKKDFDLITAGDINWSDSRIQADLLQRLNKDNFKGVVFADIEKHAKDLDAPAERGIHTRVASALLLESIPMQPTSGLDPAELALAILRPDEAGPEPSEALDRLAGVCWHTYPLAGGRGWQFRYEPNIIKQIEERMSDVPLEDARSRVRAEAQGYFQGPFLKVSAWPSNSRQVPESADLQLALCENEQTAKAVCSYSDDSNPQAPMSRRFRNAIMAVTTTPAALSGAVDRAQRLMAAEAIEREYKTGEAGKLVRDQLQRIMPELRKQFRLQTCRAFDRVVFSGGASYPIEEKYQVSDEMVMQKAQGQVCLRRYLEDKSLIYLPGDALDVNRFMKDILPGTTPLPDQPQVFTAKAVHERFLSAPNLRLIPDGGIVRQTVFRAVREGKIVVRLSDGRAYDKDGCVEGPEGRRRRISGELSTLSLDDSNFVGLRGSEASAKWLKEDQRGHVPGPVNDGPPSPPERGVRASTWTKAEEYAKDRPLLKLELTAHSPVDSHVLLSLAQPLGAETILLTVDSGGDLKDGGRGFFKMEDVKPSNALKPLEIAQRLYGATAEGAVYEAILIMNFGKSGRTGLDSIFRGLAEKAPEGISLNADFDKPLGGNS